MLDTKSTTEEEIIEQALDEADIAATASESRYSAEVVFDRIKENLKRQ